MNIRFEKMRGVAIFFFLILLSSYHSLFAQGNSLGQAVATLNTGAPMPEKILSTRSVVLFSPNFNQNELKAIHDNMLRTGIDAVAYFESDRIFVGYDIDLAYSDYFTKREIVNLIIVDKTTTGFVITITKYNGTSNFFLNQPAWQFSHSNLKEALNEVYRTALSGNTKQNLLINEIPEVNLAVTTIPGQRIEAFAYDLKVDKLAVPKFKDSTLNKELEEIMKSYPFRYELTNPDTPEADLRKQGFFYIVRFAKGRNVVVKEQLGYQMGKPETAFVSMTYPNGEVKLKTIPINTVVYKFYVRKIDSGNVYFGTKWDADTTWQQALLNFIKSFKTELRID
jgi:hypothetical protein